MTYLAGDGIAAPLALRTQRRDLDRTPVRAIEARPGMPRTYQRVATCAAADLLAQAAAILRDTLTVDAYMLAANRTAEVLGVLTLGAEQLHAPLPPSASDTADDLRLWALTVKRPEQPRPRAKVVREATT
jgi:hypothetical protein